MLIYAQLEDQAIARIKSASDNDALGYRLASIDSYGGEFDDETFFTQIRKFPAIWVTVGGDKPKRISARVWECSLTLAVMVGSRNVRGERFTRHGAVGEVGSYQLVQDARDLLAGQTFNGLVAALDVGPVRTLFNTRMGREAWSVLAIEFNTRYTYRLPEPDPGEYTGMVLGYYTQPDTIASNNATPAAEDRIILDVQLGKE